MFYKFKIYTAWQMRLLKSTLLLGLLLAVSGAVVARAAMVESQVPPDIGGAAIPELGKLEVSSFPSGARVYLDGHEQRNRTPLNLSEVAVGSHQVKVHLDRYYDAEQTVVVAVDAVARIDLDLKGGNLLLCGKLWLEPEAAHRCLAEAEARKQASLVSEFVTVPSGCFQMGDGFGGGGVDERPVHEVCLDTFAIGKYEVTQGLWRAVMGKNPAYFQKGDNFPVEHVSWNDAQNFIVQLNDMTGKNFRLPSEAEWEYAARSGGKNELYAGGDKLTELAWYDANSGSTTHAVGSKKPNGLGIYDMSGNVAEWVQDWYGSEYYSASPRNNPLGQSGGSSGRVYRGGGWNTGPGMERTSKRDRYEPRNYFAAIGFRLAYSIK